MPSWRGVALKIRAGWLGYGGYEEGVALDGGSGEAMADNLLCRRVVVVVHTMIY